MMNLINIVKDPEWWRTLLGNDFNKGFISALCLVLVLMFTLFLLRGFFFLLFRTRRCRNIEVQRADGNTLVSADVIASVVERELAAYPTVRSEKILLTRRGRRYELTIYCSYLLSDQSGIPAFCDEFKPRLTAVLERGFGITRLHKIRFWVCEPECQAEGAVESHTKDAYIGL